MKKIIAFILAVFFVLLSPLSAFASTTESILMYAAVEDEYTAMPLSFPSYENFYFQSGFFHPSSNSYDFSSKVLYPDSGGSIYSIYTDSSYDKFDDYPALRFTVSPTSSYSPGLSYSVNSSFRYLFSVGSFYQMYNSFEQRQFLLSSGQPFNAFATVTYSYNYQIYDEDDQTWYSRSGSQSEDVPLSLSLSPISNVENVTQLIWDLSFQAGEPVFDKGDQVRNVSARVSGISMTIVFPSFGSMYFGSGIDNNLVTNCLLLIDNAKLDFFYQSGGTSSSGNNTSVGNAISSVSRQVTSLSSKLSTVQNSIESKIDTMGNNIVTGLNNVISSAQQNTQNIINTVTQKVDQVKETVTEVKDSILDLPNKIQEMLLGLIVPDSDTMADKYSEFSGLLEEKLGVIYQIPMMLFDFFDTIVNAATTPQSTLTLPAFRLPWIDGSQLTIWNSMEYKIIPDGLEVLSDLIRTVTSMTVVVLTFNSVKQAYERFLRS